MMIDAWFKTRLNETEIHMTDARNENLPGSKDVDKHPDTYAVAADPADLTRAPLIVSQSRAKTAPSSTVESDDSDDLDADDEEHESLPPPISRATDPRMWLIIASVCAALIGISWLAGAPQLALPVPTTNGMMIPELSLGDRLGGALRTLVFVPLATLAAVFGLLSLAFIHQRPVGDVRALFAKCLASVTIAMLVWLVPSEIRMIKQLLNVLVVPLAATACWVPMFRLHPRDAAVAGGFALMGMMLLVLGAWIVVWSTGA